MRRPFVITTCALALALAAGGAFRAGTPPQPPPAAAGAAAASRPAAPAAPPQPKLAFTTPAGSCWCQIKPDQTAVSKR